MIAIVAPEPVPWLAVAAAMAGRDGPVEVFAPWVLADRAGWRAAARRVDFARRRLAPDAAGAHCATWRGWPLAELALAAWIRRRTDRWLAALFWRRAAVDRLAARWLATLGDLRGVIAPSGAAQRCFAVAAERGARRVLLEDLPGLRQLQEDLDRAAAAHPDCRFLRRYRAPLTVVARQEAEWALADQLLIRGRFAAATRRRAGIDAARLVPWPPPTDGARATDHAGRATDDADRATDDADRAPGHGGRGVWRRRRRILLAGLAAARHGTAEALALLRARDSIELVVRAGEGFEPLELASHPRAILHPAGPAGERDLLRGVDLVIAPSWCEAYPPELARAARHGLPIIATGRAAGFLEPYAVEPGDGAGLVATVDRLLAPIP